MNERKYFLYVMKSTDDSIQTEICGITSNVKLMSRSNEFGFLRTFEFTEIYSGCYDMIRKLRNDIQKECEIRNILNRDFSNVFLILLSNSSTKCREILNRMITDKNDYDVKNVTSEEVSKFSDREINFMKSGKYEM